MTFTPQQQHEARVRAQQRKRGLFRRFWDWVVSFKHAFFGALKNKKLADLESPERSEAQEAVNWLVYATNLPPDCVNALVFNGGCAIRVKHRDAWEMFICNTYREAASKAYEWWEEEVDSGNKISAGAASTLNRHERRKFDAVRRKRKAKRVH